MAVSNCLKLVFQKNIEVANKVNHYEFRNKPFADSDVFLAKPESFRLLTKGRDVKRVYNLKLSFENTPYNFLPGDTVGILPRNNEKEIDQLLSRLNVGSHKEEVYRLEILQNTTKKNAALPKHIPEQGTLKDIFLYYIDLHKPPKKLFLKALIPFTKDEEDIKLLETICSPKGSKEYATLIEKAHTLLNLLRAFPSCNPPLEIILEHSLPLHPRYYSISSSPLRSDSICITFFVVENEDGTKGVCTGWLEDIIKEIDTQPEIPLYYRKPNNFRIPVDISTPIIMIGTGTGISPFMSFLDHRLMTKANSNNEVGNTYLFYGCRYAERDFLYRSELEMFLKNNVLTKIYTAFSRDSETKWYVQDEINRNSEEFVNSILQNRAVVYVCGDSKTVVKGVKGAIVDNVITHGHLDESDANSLLNEMVKQNRFIADCWS